MLKKIHRLSKTKDIKETSARGRSFFKPLFTIKHLAKEDPVRRFTIVVSTKVSPKAVVRNRIKRHLRETIRLHLNSFKSGNYVVYVKPKSASAKPALLKGEFLALVENKFFV